MDTTVTITGHLQETFVGFGSCAQNATTADSNIKALSQKTIANQFLYEK